METKWRVGISAKAFRRFEVTASTRDEAVAKALEMAHKLNERWLASLYHFKVEECGTE